MKPIDSVSLVYTPFYFFSINAYNIKPGKDLNDQLVRFPNFID